MNTNFGNKLMELRKSKSISLADLGRSVGVSKQTIHRYENNVKTPSTNTLIELSKVFEKDPSYFFEDNVFDIEIGDISFREKESITPDSFNIENVKSNCKNYLQRLFELQELLGEEVKFNNPLEGIEITTKKDVEKAAKNLRRKWKIGFNAIPDVTDLMESKNISVIEMDLIMDFTGLMGFANETIPFVVVNENLKDTSRKRFTLLHELAHIVLEFAEELSHGLKEKLCNHFAGAILLIDDTLLKELGTKRTTISIHELKAIKEKYGISIQSIIIRARVTGLISYQTSEDWWNSYETWRSNNTNTNSFGQFLCKEKPLKLDKLIFRGINETRISWEKASNLKNIPIDTLRDRYEHLELKMK